MVLPFRTKWGKPPRPTHFEEKILDGRKKHTLRTDEKDRWKAGNKIHFVVGNRTKDRREFMSDECTGTQMVTLLHLKGHNQLVIGIHGKEKALTPEQAEQFALNDGFDSWQEFEEWFIDLLVTKGKRCINLKLIHWTDLRY